jgi:hypothetical protein
VEELIIPSIIEDTRTKSTLDYIIDQCEPINAFEGEFLHFRIVPAPICLQNLLSFSHLPVRKTCDKEPLIDYNYSHVVTSNEYLQILCQKAMDKKIVEVIREQRIKEREETKKRRAINSHNVIDKIVQRLVQKQYKAYFNFGQHLQLRK